MRAWVIGSLTSVLLMASGCVTLPGQDQPLFGSPQVAPSASAEKETSEDDFSTSVYTLPDLRPGIRPALFSDEAGLWMMVDKVEDQLKTSGNLVRDEKINQYVRRLVCKLAGPHCKDIRTYVVRVPAFNASMMPNGVMQVWTGLILRARNEAQLAAVLGHEIGHYLRRHSLQRMRDARAATDFLIFFQMAAAYAGVPSAGNLAELLALGSIMAFSRENERESDKFGHRFLVENGYDPREAAKIWEQLIRENKASEEFQFRSLFFATHPPPEERTETLMRLANKSIGDGPPGETGRKGFLEVFRHHRESYLRDDLRLGRFSKSLELLKMLEEDGENVAEVKYFEGEVYRLRKKDKDLDKALKAYQVALKVGAPPPEIHRSLGLVYTKLKKTEKARASFTRYLELLPDAPDNMMIRYLIETTS
jgi:predicted Zn-dependent protease